MSLRKYIFILSASLFFLGCAKEEEFNNTETQVGRSKVTFFPVLQRSGREVMSIVKGSSFTDPGVKATEGGNEIPVTVTGTVNTAETGFYRLSYTATNKDGFSASTERIVVVIPEAEKPGVDLSGEYLPIGGAPSNAIVTKIDQGLYYSTNIWGGGSLAVIPAYFISTDGQSLIVPLQELNSNIGRVQSEGPGTYNNGRISWTITRLDFSSGPLTIAKQWQKL